MPATGKLGAVLVTAVISDVVVGMCAFNSGPDLHKRSASVIRYFTFTPSPGHTSNQKRQRKSADATYTHFKIASTPAILENGSLVQKKHTRKAMLLTRKQPPQ